MIVTGTKGYVLAGVLGLLGPGALLQAQETGGATHAVSADPIASAAWLAGCWELRTDRRSVLEVWMPAEGGMMLGSSRTVAGGVARQYEHLRLHADGERLVYTAIPSGQREAAFTSPAAAPLRADSLVFENPAHDFPQRLVYRRLGADSLTVRVEGPGPGGSVRGFDQPMRRVRCEPPA
ncbi:MAG: hypothetical protein KJZ74_00910 [Gemmatimonadales bacterium]|nr:hypothetical protein [Gemmatimonadales bacterium]